MERSFNPFRRNKVEQEESPKKPEMLPQATALLEQFEKKGGATPESVEAMTEVLRTITEQSIQNSNVFHSEKSGAEFPYTSLSLRDVAAEILRSRGVTIPEAAEAPSEKKKREFIIVSFPPVVQAGGQFEWAELPAHSITMMLPQALEDLQAGKEPKDYEVLTLGYPTNEFGLISEEFEKELSQDAVAAIAGIHSEFIESKIEKEGLDKDAHVALTGVSLGSSVAAEIGSRLLQEGNVTQKEEEKPRLAVAMYAPVGDKSLNDGPLRAAQVATGFGSEIIAQALVNPGVKTVGREMGGFMEGVRNELSGRMDSRLDEEQSKRKISSIISLAKAVAKGRDLPENLKATEVLGILDPLAYSVDRSVQYLEQEKEHPDALGTNTLDRPTDNQRLFGVRMPHLVPFYRDSEWQRFEAAAKAIQNIKKN